MSDIGLDTKVRDLVLSFKKVLDDHDAHLKSFCDHGVQVEGWLKGELLGFLEQQKVRFSREEKASIDKRKKVDFKIELTTETGTEYAWIELKHWLIGYQKGVKYDASFYFGDPTSVGISQDAKKLTKIPDNGRYILVLATANPGDEEWQKGLAKFNEKFIDTAVEALTQPRDFPDHYCVGLLKVSEPVRQIK